jgi:hypothetical protein
MRLTLFLVLSSLFFTADWPQFRGPGGQGVSDEKNVPLTWSETKNVRWKTAIPGRGWSSPVIQGDRIWLTTATEDGRSLRAISVNVNTGAIEQNVELFQLKSPKLMNAKNRRQWSKATAFIFTSARTALRVSRSLARSCGRQNSNMTTGNMDRAGRRSSTTTY